MVIFPDTLLAAARSLLEAARGRGLKIVTAESCTGGLVAALLTEIAGSSDVVERGYVAYSNEAKQESLGVEAATLAAHGAVSAETAREMASGALRASRADVAIAITGVAGPGGGSPEKPIGLVHFACAGPAGRMTAVERRFGEIGRGGVRMASVEQALLMLGEAIAGSGD